MKESELREPEFISDVIAVAAPGEPGANYSDKIIGRCREAGER